MDDKRLIAMMERNGMHKHIATILLELKNANGEKLSQGDLVMKTGITQPNVSIAIAKAYRDNQVNFIVCREDGKRRPYYRYYLTRPFPDIILSFIEERSRELCQAMIDLKSLVEVA